MTLFRNDCNQCCTIFFPNSFEKTAVWWEKLKNIAPNAPQVWPVKEFETLKYQNKMNLEQLEKGKKIAEQIEKCKAEIEAAKYTQYENIVIRKTYLKVNGLDDSIEVPESLFRVVGKLILSEWNQKLRELENEFQML